MDPASRRPSSHRWRLARQRRCALIRPPAAAAHPALMSAFRPILFIIGIFVVTMGLAMIVPAITDAIAGHRDWITFAISAGCAAFVGGLMVTGSMGSPITLTLRPGFELPAPSWIVFSAVGPLPLAFPGLGLRSEGRRVGKVGF